MENHEKSGKKNGKDQEFYTLTPKLKSFINRAAKSLKLRSPYEFSTYEMRGFFMEVQTNPLVQKIVSMNNVNEEEFKRFTEKAVNEVVEEKKKRARLLVCRASRVIATREHEFCVDDPIQFKVVSKQQHLRNRIMLPPWRDLKTKAPLNVKISRGTCPAVKYDSKMNPWVFSEENERKREIEKQEGSCKERKEGEPRDPYDAYEKLIYKLLDTLPLRRFRCPISQGGNDEGSQNKES